MDVERFTKVCGLLGSPHDGERSAAALKASEMLKAAGFTWQQVRVNGETSSDGAMAEMFIAKSETLRLQMLLADERVRIKRLEAKLDTLKREVTKLQQRAAGSVRTMPDGTMVDPDSGEVLGKKKLSKAERKEYYRAQHYEHLREKQKTEREANPRTVEPGDWKMRDAMREVLQGHPSERTVEFYTSVLDQKAWTVKQREAIERSLRWTSKTEAT